MGDFSPNSHEKTSFSYKKLDEINDDFLSFVFMRQITKLALLKEVLKSLREHLNRVCTGCHRRVKFQMMMVECLTV